MQTAEVVAIIVVAVGIVAIVYLLRERLTRFAFKFGNASVEADAAAPPRAPAPPPLEGRGLSLDRSTVKGSKIKVVDSTLIAQKSKVKDSTIDVSEHPGSDTDA